MKRIVLCRTEGPRNLGSVLRATQNFGPAEIVLVAPSRPSLLVHPEFEQMAHGAHDARAAIRVVPTLQDALAGAAWAIGFTARARGKRAREDWRDVAPRAQALADSGEDVLALVFGSEAEGLTGEEVDLCQELSHVRTAQEHTSINLALTASLVLWTLFTGTEVHQRERPAKRLADQGRRFLIERMVEVFAGKVARTPAAADSIERSLRRVFGRAPLENRDARAWHLMLRALGSELSPSELGLFINAKNARREEELLRRKALIQDATEQRGTEGAEGAGDARAQPEEDDAPARRSEPPPQPSRGS
ncbi:MAG: RNA methyltransferase [Planctomycetota bacterium]